MSEQRAGSFAGTGWTALVLGWRASPACTVLRVALTLVVAACAPLAALTGKLLVDELTRGREGELATVTGLAAATAVLGAVSLMGGHLMSYLVARHEAAVTMLAESDLFQKVCSFVGIKYFEDPTFHDQLMVAESSAAEGPSAVTNFALDVCRAVVSLAGFLIVIAVSWPLLAVLLLLAALPGLVAEIRLANRHLEATMVVSPLHRRRYFYRSLLTDDRAAKEVRLFGLGAFFRGRQLEALRESQQVEVDLARRTMLVQSALGLLGALVSGIAIVVVARRVLIGAMTAGDVLLFVAAIAGVQSALSQIVGEIGMASRSIKLFQRFCEVMALEPDLTSGNRALPPMRQSLRFEDVWFRYSETGPWVLSGVSFELPVGTSLGVVGVNGAGKSTMVKLLCRFYDSERGRILWDGVDLREYAPDSVRSRLAATFQDFMTYDLTVGENIGIGSLPRFDDKDAIRNAAAQVDVDTAINQLPRGYDTLLSRIFFEDESNERGAELSGGQWQRVALARSLLRSDADLLVLDEPSSGLDADAEHHLHRTLQEFRRGRTSFLVSHRLGSLREADSIIVLDGGQIAEQGEHASLLALGGTYARLFNTQAHGYQPIEVSA